VAPRLGVFNHRPPPWFCGANQVTRLPSPLAPSIQEWTPQLPPGPIHRRPPHGPSVTVSPRQLTVDTRRPYTCNQRPSTRYTARLTIHSSQPGEGTQHSSKSANETCAMRREKWKPELYLGLSTRAKELCTASNVP